MENQPKSLKELGFKIEPIKGKDEKGNEWLFRVRGKEPVFFIKRTKRGKLLVFRDKEDKVDTTIHGLFDFKIEGEGEQLDLVGKRTTATSTGKQGSTSKAA